MIQQLEAAEQHAETNRKLSDNIVRVVCKTCLIFIHHANQLIHFHAHLLRQFLGFFALAAQRLKL
jgi:hypothetical protein